MRRARRITIGLCPLASLAAGVGTFLTLHVGGVGGTAAGVRVPSWMPPAALVVVSALLVRRLRRPRGATATP